MVQNINKLNGKITENGYKKSAFAHALGMSEVTLRNKINKENSDFSIEESLKVKDKLKLSTQDYLDIFFGTKLELNSDCYNRFA